MSCNWSSSPWADEYLDENGDIDTTSPFYLAAPEELYTNVTDPEWLANHSAEWDADWNQFVWTIEDNSDMLPCNETDLWCQLVVGLYLVSH